MDRNEILEHLSIEKLKELMEHLGSEYCKEEKDYFIFSSICHGNPSSHKLYYYKESSTFHCYSACSCNYSIFDLIKQVLGLDFSDSFKYLANFLGIAINQQKKKVGFNKTYSNADLNFLRLQKNRSTYVTPKQQVYNDNVLNMFDKAITQDWREEGISLETAEKFELGFYINQNCMIIPVRDINGDLIGIRKRNYFKDELEQGRKYVPILIQNTLYNFPTNVSLYGIYQNQNYIRKYKKVVLFESEKSVLKYDSIYKENIALSIFGMNFSRWQRDVVLSLGVEEVIIALDKQYIQEDIDNKANKINYNEFTLYLKKIKKIVKMFEKQCNASIIMDFYSLIEYKSSPIDCGKENFETLLKKRVVLSSEEIQEEINKREKIEP